jgi:protein O-GlcNAc transferase
MQSRLDRESWLIGFHRGNILSSKVAELMERINYLRENQLWQEVAECYVQILHISPDHLGALLGLSQLLYQSGAVVQSQQLLKRRLHIMPDDNETKYLLGRGWLDLGKPAAALDLFKEILMRDPIHYATLRIMGQFLFQQAKLEESRRYVERFHKAYPTDLWGLKVLMRVLFLLGLVVEAEMVAKNAIEAAHKEPNLLEYKYDLISIYLFIVSHNESHTFAELFARHLQAMKGLTCISKSFYEPKSSITIGIISDSFAQLPIGQCLLPIYQSYEKQSIEIVSFSFTLKRDGWTEVFAQKSAQWIDCTSVDEEEFARLLSYSSCDVLIDTFGYACATGDYFTMRLNQFCKRHAPLQFMMFGHPLSMGAKIYDIFVGDSVLIPRREEERFYTEQVVRIPSVFAPYAPVLPLPQITLEENATIRLGSTHKVAKLSQKTLLLWSRVLVTYPEVEILIIRDHLVSSSEERIRGFMMEMGVKAHQIIFLSDIPTGSFLQIYNSFDILLDTLHWSGHITACNALSMGVPVVTMYGDNSAGRMVSSLLQTMGNSDWVASSEQEYINIIGQLIVEKRTHSVRQKFRQKFLSSAVCDGANFTNELLQIIKQCLMERRA